MVRSQVAARVTEGKRHRNALKTSSFLTLTYRRMYQRGAAMVTPEAVIRSLNRAGVRFVLMGTHGIGGWRDQPRATQDVDVLVAKKDVRKAVRALHASYPALTLRDLPVVARFLDPATNQPVIDVMKPNQDVYRIVFRHTIWVGSSHRIPSLEMALVSKFAAMTSPHRSVDKKLIDAGDFANMARHNRESLDRHKLARLADKVYPDGSVEVLQILEDVLAGRPVRF
jgi:hypothetical protein